MGNDQTAELQHLIDRANQGDDEARNALITRAYERLRHLSAKILLKSFPRLKAPPSLVDASDVANEVAYRLYYALETIKPASSGDFFRLAAQRIRWLLIDLARQADRTGQRGGDDRQRVQSYEICARSGSDDGASGVAELYEQIEGLPTHEREVVDLLYFHGLSQTETATQMGVTERTVRRYWTIARARLFHALQKNLPPEAARITIDSDRLAHD
jgi:RNA polymerase sigma factor (TIGR02999 family)